MNTAVSICCITYNHNKYIKKTLESFISQKTNFPFIVLIVDDCSTDGTQAIIREYANKFPELIKPVFLRDNQFSNGEYVNLKYNFSRINSKYVALCEGDDFWISDSKLQQQFTFLESHIDYSMCFHPVLEFWEGSEYPQKIYPNIKKNKISFKELLKWNFIPTSSVMYRWRFNEENVTDYFSIKLRPGDWLLHLLHAEIGKIGRIDECMGCYRKHKNGIWRKDGDYEEKFFITNGIYLLNFYSYLEKKYKKKYTYRKKQIITKLIYYSLKCGRFDLINELQKNFYDEYLEYFNQNIRYNNKFYYYYNKFIAKTKDIFTHH